MVLVHESDPRFGAFDFGAAYATAPEDLKEMISSHESLPFRRRGYERDGMLQTLIEHAGFKALLEGARAPIAMATLHELAKVPAEIQHFDLENFHDRPVQAALVELLLLPKGNDRFTSCVVMHGMGGTGKTVTVVAVVQGKAVRQHFSHMYWLTGGADAVGGQIRQLQSSLHKQLTGKSMSSAEAQQKEEHEWLGLLVGAMAMGRALVVLDDPWLPEQVRYLNPVDDGAETEHRLLVTTRIRGLAHSRATCIELSMMAKEEAAVLLLDVAGIDKHTYQSDNPGAAWPPPAAYDLAAECGLLPITLTITAQLVRSWGKGWEKAVLPMLREEQKAGAGRSTTTVEERIIGAGLKSLKGKADGPAIEALFEMFAVTQEDFVHPMAVIELLWRSCCALSTEAADGLSARLKVRQWTHLLIDQSLLLGSSSKGVHLHDIVLTYLRKRQNTSELRAQQKRVVEGLVAASMERTAATGRGFQDTGSTAKAFDGEEVDWYVCNVASYHVKQSMDPSVPLVENEDLRRWLLLDDEAITRAAAAATGIAELELLVAQCDAGAEWFEAAKVAHAMGMAGGSRTDRLRHGRAALDFLQKVVSATTQAQQLELDLRSSLGFAMDRKSGEQKRNTGRMEELMKHNNSLRMDPLGLYLTSAIPRIFVLCGMHPACWDAGQVATEETAQEGVCMGIRKGVLLCTKAAEESVGARKEYIRLAYEILASGMYMPMRSTDEAVEVQQRCQEAKWGRDGSIFTATCMAYRFERHFDISQGLAAGFDGNMMQPCAQYLAEYCGDVQQMAPLFEKQLGAVQSFAKRGVPGLEIGYYWAIAASSFTGLELQALYPFGTRVVALLESFSGQCIDPSGCEEWYGSSDWSAWTAKCGDGASSKDGLHHYCLKTATIFNLQALLSLSLASINNGDFDLSWLDSLLSADDLTLHDCNASAIRFTNTRVLIAEVLEWQGRHEEAVRFVSCFIHTTTTTCMQPTCIRADHSLTYRC
jgi:hypothetical protein